MGMFTNSPPNLPLATEDYDPGYINQVMNVLRIWFNNQNAVQQISLSGLNINPTTLPTESSLASLRVGDVYRDTTAGNVLKIKV